MVDTTVANRRFIPGGGIVLDMEPSAVPKRPRSPGRFLLRGESVVASTGLLLATVLLTCMVAMGFWMARVQRNTLQSVRVSEIESLGDLLTQVSERLLVLDELTAVRRLLADVGRTYELQRCRIVLADGEVLADADPSKITLTDAPSTWGEAGLATAHEADPDLLSRNSLLVVARRGTARLELTAGVSYPKRAYWETQAGVAVIASIALVAQLLIYRRVRRRVMALGIIREALLDLAGGEKSPEALSMRGDLAPEARAWNVLVAQNQKLRKELVSTRAGEILSARPSADRQLQEMCDAMRQGIILVDKEMKANYVNGAAAVYLASTAKALVGAEIARFVPREVLDLIKKAVGGAGRSWTSVEIDQRDKNPGGVLRFRVRPLRREDASAAMIGIDDVTQQRVADEARNAFITQVTHELRAPLTNIRLYTEQAIEDGEQDPQMRDRCLNVISQEARRLEGIVTDMLSVAEIEAGTMSLRKDDVRLELLVEALKADYSGLADEKNITLEFKLPPKLPVIHADRDKIGLALHNLVNNALKYTPAGGRVEVKVDVKDGNMTIEVVDSGIGIAEVDLAQIFDRFYRAKDPKVSEVTGSGLGLALAREVIRLHGGDIHVESEVGKGSTFSVILPATSAKAA